MSNPGSTPYPTRRHLRRACNRLTPVVLDFGPDQPRFESYLSELSGTGAQTSVRLSPIAVDRLPPDRRATIRSRDPDEPIAIEHARLEPLGEDGAVVDLRGTRLHRMDRRRSARRNDPQAPLTLVVPTGTEDGDMHVFPVVDLGGDHCSIEATAPLTPGEPLEPVEVVGDRRALRRARAVVREVIPWIDAHGRRRFRCRMELAATGDSGPATRDIVGERRRIGTILELAATAQTPFRARTSSGATLRGVVSSSSDATLELSLDEWHVAAAPSHLVASFQLFGAAYEMRVRVISWTGRTARTAFPLTLRRMRVRGERRVTCPPGEATVSFLNPATDERCTRELIDVSFGGLAFRRARQDVCWEDLPFEDARLEWRGRRCALGELRVRGASEDVVHASIALGPPSEDHLLIDMLATLGHPQLGIDRGDDFRGVLEAYRRSGILHGYMVRNLEPVAMQAAHAWRVIRSQGPELTRTLVHEEDGETDATISVLRSWDNGWIVQHFGASSADGFRWSGELQMASLDYLIPRPSGRYVFFFVETRNRSMNAFYQRFFKLTGTSEAIERSTVQLWSLPAATEPARVERDPRWTLRRLRAKDEPLVARAAARTLGPMTSAALSLVPGEMRLPALSKAYRRIGLERARDLEILSHQRRPAFVLFHERCSPGLNLTGKLNASWLLPIHAGAEHARPALEAALSRVHQLPTAAPGLDRFLIVPDGMDREPLAEHGWEHQMTVNTYVLNRAGLVRYYDYVADRYGAADLRAARRSARGRVREIAS